MDREADFVISAEDKAVGVLKPNPSEAAQIAGSLSLIRSPKSIPSRVCFQSYERTPFRISETHKSEPHEKFCRLDHFGFDVSQLVTRDRDYDRPATLNPPYRPFGSAKWGNGWPASPFCGFMPSWLRESSPSGPDDIKDRKVILGISLSRPCVNYLCYLCAAKGCSD